MPKFRIKIEVTQTYEFTTETNEFENEHVFEDRLQELGVDWEQLDKHAEMETVIEVVPVRADAEVDRENWQWVFGG